ncbi:MAG: VWA domain-containing protein [Bryobacteraceae bacterium]
MARNRFSLRFLAAVFILGFAAVHCLASPPPRRSPTNGKNPYTITDNVDLVLLDVSVRYRHGGYVKGLTKNNFHVYEDGHARRITQFGTMDAPVSIGLVVDNSGSMREKRPDVVLAGLAFARQSNPHDEFFVVNFNDRIAFGLPRGVPFTDSLELLRKALYYGQPYGETALYDAIAAALAHLERSRLDVRTLIVVSDGGDNASEINLRELTKLVEASRATIYTVGLFDPYDADRNPKILRKLASISGGQYMQPETTREIVPVLRKISTDVRSRYTVGYRPDEVKDKRTVRTVKVTARKRGKKLIVRTRTTYTMIPFTELMTRDESR